MSDNQSAKCPVCGKTAEEVKLLRCSACRAVSYCSVEHQKQGKAYFTRPTGDRSRASSIALLQLFQSLIDI